MSSPDSPPPRRPSLLQRLSSLKDSAARKIRDARQSSERRKSLATVGLSVVDERLLLVEALPDVPAVSLALLERTARAKCKRPLRFFYVGERQVEELDPHSFVEAREHVVVRGAATCPPVDAVLRAARAVCRWWSADAEHVAIIAADSTMATRLVAACSLCLAGYCETATSAFQRNFMSKGSRLLSQFRRQGLHGLEQSESRLLDDFSLLAKHARESDEPLETPTLELVEVVLHKLPQLAMDGCRLMISVTQENRFLYSSLLQGDGLHWVPTTFEAPLTVTVPVRRVIRGSGIINAYHIPENQSTHNPRQQMCSVHFHTIMATCASKDMRLEFDGDVLNSPGDLRAPGFRVTLVFRPAPEAEEEEQAHEPEEIHADEGVDEDPEERFEAPPAAVAVADPPPELPWSNFEDMYAVAQSAPQAQGSNIHVNMDEELAFHLQYAGGEDPLEFMLAATAAAAVAEANDPFASSNAATPSDTDPALRDAGLVEQEPRSSSPWFTADDAAEIEAEAVAAAAGEPPTASASPPSATTSPPPATATASPPDPRLSLSVTPDPLDSDDAHAFSDPSPSDSGGSSPRLPTRSPAPKDMLWQLSMSPMHRPVPAPADSFLDGPTLNLEASEGEGGEEEPATATATATPMPDPAPVPVPAPAEPEQEQEQEEQEEEQEEPQPELTPEEQLARDVRLAEALQRQFNEEARMLGAREQRQRSDREAERGRIPVTSHPRHRSSSRSHSRHSRSRAGSTPSGSAFSTIIHALGTRSVASHRSSSRSSSGSRSGSRSESQEERDARMARELQARYDAENGSSSSRGSRARYVRSSRRVRHRYRRSRSAASTEEIQLLPTFKCTGKYLTEECQICQQQFEAEDVLRTLPCIHAYHQACIDRWLQMKSTCPICNRSIRE